jgi:hypothetical protein
VKIIWMKRKATIGQRFDRLLSAMLKGKPLRKTAPKARTSGQMYAEDYGDTQIGAGKFEDASAKRGRKSLSRRA